MQTDNAEIHRAWITLGSNIEPVHNLPAAVRALQRVGTVRGVSSVWQSAPVGDLNQADFCNAAVLIETLLSPVELKRKLRELETQQGRVRDPQNKNAARTIDLDIAFYDDLVINSTELRIPDPDIGDRPFLAVPLQELSPDFVHPESGESLRVIAERTQVSSLIRRDDIVLS